MSERKRTQVNVFHGRRLPEPGTPAGYAALINRYELRVPLPPRLAAVAERSRPRSTHDWQLLTPRHVRPETLVGDLEFALKWEGARSFGLHRPAATRGGFGFFTNGSRDASLICRMQKRCGRSRSSILTSSLPSRRVRSPRATRSGTTSREPGLSALWCDERPSSSNSVE